MQVQLLYVQLGETTYTRQDLEPAQLTHTGTLTNSVLLIHVLVGGQRVPQATIGLNSAFGIVGDGDDDKVYWDNVSVDDADPGFEISNNISRFFDCGTNAWRIYFE